MTVSITIDEVKEIALAASSEAGVQFSDLASGKKHRVIVAVRRDVIQRAAAAGAAPSVIAAALGMHCGNVSRVIQQFPQTAPHSGTVRRLLRPFVRHRNRVSPLLVEDYARRAGIAEEAARDALTDLCKLGMISSSLLMKSGQVTVYEVTQTGLSVIAA